MGEVFQRYAQNIVREAEKAESELSSMRGGGTGELSIGVSSVYCLYYMPRIVSRLIAGDPNARILVDVFSHHNDEVISKLRSARWDIAVTHSSDQAKLPSDIAARVIGTSTSSVYCHKDHPLSQKQEVSLRDMAPYEWVTTNLGGAETLLKSNFQTISVPPKIRVRASTMGFVIALCRNHGFLCIAPDDMVYAEVVSGSLVRVDQQALHVESQISLIYSNLLERTTLTKAIMALCVAERDDRASSP